MKILPTLCWALFALFLGLGCIALSLEADGEKQRKHVASHVYDSQQVVYVKKFCLDGYLYASFTGRNVVQVNDYDGRPARCSLPQ